MTTQINYNQIKGAPVSVFDYMTAAQIAAIQHATVNTNTGLVTAITAAIAASKHLIFPAGVYDLGTQAAATLTRLFTIAGGGGKVTLATEGFVKFTVASSGVGEIRVFEVNDCDGLYVGEFHLTDTAYAGAGAGAGFLTLASNSTTRVKNAVIDAVYVDGGTHAIQVIAAASSDPRNEAIHIGLISANNVQYGYSAQNSGDCVVINALYSVASTARDFFVYGCKDVSANIYMKNHTAGGSGAVLIKAYDADTNNIRLNVHVSGTTTVGNLVVFEHQNDTQASIISDCDVKLVVDTSYAYQRFAFRSYNLAGTLQQTTTCKWYRVNLSGDMGTGFVPVSGTINSATYASRPYSMLGVQSVPAAYSTMSLSPELMRLLQPGIQYLNNFIVSASEGDYITYLPASASVIGLSMTYPINVDAFGSWYLFTFTALEDDTAVAAQVTTHACYAVFIYESGGATTAGTPQKMWEAKTPATTPAVIAVAGTAGAAVTITFTCGGAEYAVANKAYVKLLVQRASWMTR
jgi:hypothetical protein